MNKGFRLAEIISGGQTGADQGGLLAAQDLGIPTGGTATGMADGERSTGSIVAQLRPRRVYRVGLFSAHAQERASRGWHVARPYRSGGSGFTARIAREAGKPLFHLAYVPNLGIVPNERMEEFRYWLERYNIHILNVAGNRESNSPGIQELTRSFLLAALGQTKVI